LSGEEVDLAPRDTFYGYDREPLLTGFAIVDVPLIIREVVRAIKKGEPVFRPARALTFVVADGAIRVFISKGYATGRRTLLAQHDLPARIELLSDPYRKQRHIVVQVGVDDATYAMPRGEALDMRALAVASA
jgi:hypothetical protein